MSHPISILFVLALANPQDPAPPDVGKRLVELPLKLALASSEHPPRPDVSKLEVESSLKQALVVPGVPTPWPERALPPGFVPLAPAAPGLAGMLDPAHADLRKYAVERPLKNALAAPILPLPAPGGSVAPGLVRWHPDAESALAAARESKKPVLLFQLLGRLDDALC